jgi:serine kinase of HPr protein (carbohydrate metabolism regulator)
LLVHATCVAIDGIGVLLRGPSGSGKSDLALRLIDEGARLVADDQVEVVRAGATLTARAPHRIAGRIEVRGIGIVAIGARRSVKLGLAVDLVPRARIERMPAARRCTVVGVKLPLIKLDPFDASAPAKLRLAVRTRARENQPNERTPAKARPRGA